MRVVFDLDWFAMQMGQSGQAWTRLPAWRILLPTLTTAPDFLRLAARDVVETVFVLRGAYEDDWPRPRVVLYDRMPDELEKLPDGRPIPGHRVATLEALVRWRSGR